MIPARPVFRLARSVLKLLGLLGLGMAQPWAANTDFAHLQTSGLLLDESLREVLRSAGIRPALREDLQRPVDPRLLRIETWGIEGSGLFRGKRHVARRARDVQELSMQLAPGDQLVLTGADWTDAQFVFGGEGTWEAPILVWADPACAPFSGRSAVAFFGRNLVIMDLTFRGGEVVDAVPAASAEEPPGTNGPVTGGIANLVRVGAGPDRPAHHCIVNRLTVDNVNSSKPADWPRIITRYLLLNGHDNTVANSTFAHLKHYGDVIATGELPSATPQRLHLLNNRFTDRPRLDDDPCPYRYKIIQIGWHDLRAASAGSLIQGNLFEDCASHVELVSIKASDVFMRNNRFVRCPGAVTIRMGDRALIQDNVFDGEGRDGTGGVRLAGRDHAIIGNTFARLRPHAASQMRPPPNPPTPYLAWVLGVVAGDYEISGFTTNAYGRATNILISHNRFAQCTGRIAMGSPTPSLSPTQLLPRNVRIEHNTFGGDRKGEALFDFVAADPSGGLLAEIFTYNNHFTP
jgi:hypothetical protein